MVSFRYAPDRIRASFVYLQADGSAAQTVALAITPERIAEARSWLADAVRRIDAGASQTNAGAWCARCDFVSWCADAVR